MPVDKTRNVQVSTRRGATRAVVMTGRKLPWRQFLLSIALLAILGAALIFGARTINSIASTPIRTVTINGDLRYLDQQSLEATVRSFLPKGFFSGDLNRLRVEIEALPWVQECMIHRRWPDRLQIVITEEVPALRWGEDELLNPIGEIFQPKSIVGFDDLPALIGPDGSQRMMLDRFDTLMERLAPLGYSVASLRLDGKHSWSLVLNNGLQVIIGRRELEQRTRRLLSLLKRPDKFNAGRGSILDLRYSNGFSLAPGEKVAGVKVRQHLDVGESG